MEYDEYEYENEQKDSDPDYVNFINSIHVGHVENVIYYLENGIIDPSRNDNEPIQEACNVGNEQIVKILLEDKRVDPSVDNNYCIIISCMRGYTGVMKLLLQDTRVNPFVNNNTPIQTASEYGHVNIVKMLLDIGSDPSASNQYAIITSSQKGHVNVVKLLLNDDRVDPRVLNYRALYLASIQRRKEVVKLLIRGCSEHDVPIEQFYTHMIPAHRRYILLYYDITDIPDNVYDFNVEFSRDDYLRLKKRYKIKLSPSESKEFKRLDSEQKIDVNYDDIEFIDMMLSKFPKNSYKRAKIVRLLRLPTNVPDSLISEILNDYLYPSISSIIGEYLD